MAVIIENMAIPESCHDCDICKCGVNNFGRRMYNWCPITMKDIDNIEERHKDCPLKEVSTGKWIKHETYTSCSECGKVYPYKKVTHKFCPNCGAQMEQTGEEK